MFGKKKIKAPVKNAPRTEKSGGERKSFALKFLFSSSRGTEKQKSSRFRIIRKIAGLFDGSVIESELVIRNIPLIIFIFIWIFIAIGNGYYAQRKAQKIERLKREVKDLRDEYISTKSQLMYSTKMSEVARRLEKRGIKEPLKPPFKLFISKEEADNE